VGAVCSRCLLSLSNPRREALDFRSTAYVDQGRKVKRYILKKGDKSTNGGIITEGIESCTHHGTPITFIGARVWCNGCNSEGVIGWQGPHQKSTMMGKQQALEGDICICKCSPPPVFLASQNSAWHEFDAPALATMGYGAFGQELANAGSTYDEQYTLHNNAGHPLAGVSYRVRTGSQIVASGVTDSAGRTQRVITNGSRTIRLEIAD